MTGKYQTYPEYKDSGIDWLGKVPASWCVSRLAYVFTKANAGEVIDKSYWGEGDELLYTCNRTPLKSDYSEFPKEKRTEPNDLLLTRNGTPYVHKPLVDSIYSNVVQRITLDSDFNRDYLMYCLGNSAKNMKGYGVSIESLNFENWKTLSFAYPNKSEQVAVVDFLDHETAKIDILIDKQQQLIQLLKEKRQAVISHAVTKGLNPNAPMRDSGVEWLGEVPEHWVVSKFGYISQVVRGGSPRPAGDPTLFNGDYSPWVTVAEITKDDEIYLTETETFLTKKGSDQCRVFESGTLLLSNSGATLGVPAILKIDANANDGVVGFENLKINHEFAYYYLSSLTGDLRERVKQGSGQPNLNTDIVKNIAVPIPPKNEVESIVASIRKTREHYKKLEIKSIAGIELLQERRTALISAAVTGKIDVRHHASHPTGDLQSSKSTVHGDF